MIRTFYVQSNNDTIFTGPVTINDGIPYFSGDMVPLKEAYNRDPERGITLVVDVIGMQQRNMNDEAIKTKIPGSDIWYMTCIESEGDVFDGFLSNGEALLMPYHFIISDAVLSQAYDLSDSCIPVLFISKGKVLAKNGTKGLDELLDKIENLGFVNIIIFDTDDSLSKEDWTAIRSKHANAIPYVRMDLLGLEDIGFKDLIVDDQFFG
jgi:hypothetical protein